MNNSLGYIYNEKKIDFYLNGEYKHSTHAKTCKEAKARYCEQFKLNPLTVKASFSK
jgi:hypothetical protein